MNKLFLPMKKYILNLILFFSLSLSAQNRWIDYYSYLNISQIQIENNHLYGKAENSFFIKDFQTGEIERISSINGLSGETFAKIYVHQALNKIFVIHTNGLIEIIRKDQSIKKIADLKFNSFISDDKKQCNAVFVQGNLLYLAMGYGISVFDLDKEEFGDTYYIGFGGSQLEVNDVEIYGQEIYAATGQGLKKAALSGNLIDFNNWTDITSGNWKHLAVYNNKLLAAKTFDVYEVTGNNVIFKRNFIKPILDFQPNDYLVLTTFDKIFLTDENLTDIYTYSASVFNQFKANTAIDFQSNLYVGTREQGILQINIGGSGFTTIAPNCPAYNDPFGIDVRDGKIWMVYGSHGPSFAPAWKEKAISYYDGSQWTNIPYEDFQVPSLCYVKINPSNPEEVYMSSAVKGLLKVTDANQFMLYDDTNSTLDFFMAGNAKQIRVFGIGFDAENNLWITQTNEQNKNDNIKVLRNDGSWGVLPLPGVFTNSQYFTDGVRILAFDQDGILWLGTVYKGAVGVNTQSGQYVSITNGFQNTAYTYVTSLSVDKDNTLWAGNYTGLRITSNPSRAFQNPDEVIFRPIKIEYEGSVQLLLEGQGISVIKTDGSNNKWIGTTSNGVYYVSEDGKKTIYHFTTENSPLPSNEIYDLSVDGKSGMVYFATGKGLIGFKGNATDPVESMNDVYAFPNPVNMKKHNFVTIRGLMEDIFVKIIDVEGNLVYETKSKGGSVDWDLTAFGRYKVASGVYIVLLTNEDGTQTQTTKILVIK